ncbi:LPS export ABC transporter ATP-binding protein [Altererythrobacter sp. BO-6]|uniref:LPS export ABC transporter ATP-binding protein n=1 Tax=Altererythrobacter sp. BO-6 TaxID=2604537 RepID=UPI0013E17E3E|nr:LPS export ABC transporter ATP-binding protein [Altererythrobacter sp. BO-6]QIG55170.1 LPS export ABC transporter ATP-binding protein [Altererythrobacter sp. BO-6]
MNDRAPDKTVVQASGAARLEAIELRKNFGKRPVLDGVSLTIEQGEVVGLFGPDGAGKTTTFYCLLGLLRPDMGRVTLDGQDVSRLPFYRRAVLGLAYLPEQPSIFRGLTVEQNIRSMLEVVEPVRELREERLEDLLDALDLVRLRDAAATSLSGGERRRCEVARALALDPKIILLDEPFAGIDPLTIASIKEMIGEMRSRNIGILLTDQNVPEMLGVIERAYVMDGGRIIFSGTPEEMLREPLVIDHYLGQGHRS